MMMDSAIHTQGLIKRYGQLTAVDGIDLQIDQGEVFGLLGPNGSGKTTTILMLLGLTDVTAGSVRVLGLDPARQPLAVKRKVGYLPDAVGFYDQLSARANLRYTGRLAGLATAQLDERIDAVLAQVGLNEAADRYTGTFSRGMKRRLGLADVLLKAPRLIVLDEPTNDLDPIATREFLELIRELKQRDITILLSSHLLQRVQAVCDRVALFHRGHIALQGSVNELARQVLGGGYRIVLEASGDDLSRALEGIPEVGAVSANGDGCYILDASADVRPQAASRAIAAGASVHSLNLREPSLDDIYANYFDSNHAA